MPPKAASKQPRELKCARCRHHGVIVPQKGHTKFCPFLSCDCWKCYLITQRSRITALQRNLNKAQNGIQSKEQGPRDHTPEVKPAAEGTDGGGRQLAPSGPVRPPPAGGGGGGGGRSAATTAWGPPLQLQIRPAAGGGLMAGYDRAEVLPGASEEDPRTHGEFPPLPVIHLPFTISGCSSSYVPCAQFMLPRPAGLFSGGLCGPRLSPIFQSAVLHYPLPPQPGPRADCRQVTLQPPPLPEAFIINQPQPPPSTHAGDDIVELD